MSIAAFVIAIVALLFALAAVNSLGDTVKKVRDIENRLNRGGL